MGESLNEKKSTIIILSGALLIILIVLLLFIPLTKQNKESNKKYFPDYEDIIINEKVIKDKNKYDKVVKQLENDSSFNKLLMINDYNSTSASRVDLENMLTNYILLYSKTNTITMKEINNENGVFCIPEKNLIESFKELYNTNITGYMSSVKYYFEHVYQKKDRYCIYYDNVNKKYGKSIISSIESLTYNDGIVTVNAYVYSYKDKNQNDIKTKVKNIESALNNKNYSLASSIVTNELKGEAKKKNINFRIFNDGKYFKYQVIDIKTL